MRVNKTSFFFFFFSTHTYIDERILLLNAHTDKRVAEMRQMFETEKKQLLEDLRKKLEAEKKQAVEEAKLKSWCTNCGKEAVLFCCWNTTYCDYPCQEMHWHKHMATCTREDGNEDSSAVPAATADEEEGEEAAAAEEAEGVDADEDIVAESSDKVTEVANTAAEAPDVAQYNDLQAQDESDEEGMVIDEDAIAGAPNYHFTPKTTAVETSYFNNDIPKRSILSKVSSFESSPLFPGVPVTTVSTAQQQPLAASILKINEHETPPPYAVTNSGVGSSNSAYVSWASNAEDSVFKLSKPPMSSGHHPLKARVLSNEMSSSSSSSHVNTAKTTASDPRAAAAAAAAVSMFPSSISNSAALRTEAVMDSAEYGNDSRASVQSLNSTGDLKIVDTSEEQS